MQGCQLVGNGGNVLLQFLVGFGRLDQRRGDGGLILLQRFHFAFELFQLVAGDGEFVAELFIFACRLIALLLQCILRKSRRRAGKCTGQHKASPRECKQSWSFEKAYWAHACSIGAKQG